MVILYGNIQWKHISLKRAHIWDLRFVSTHFHFCWSIPSKIWLKFAAQPHFGFFPPLPANQGCIHPIAWGLEWKGWGAQKSTSIKGPWLPRTFIGSPSSYKMSLYFDRFSNTHWSQVKVHTATKIDTIEELLQRQSVKSNSTMMFWMGWRCLSDLLVVRE